MWRYLVIDSIKEFKTILQHWGDVPEHMSFSFTKIIQSFENCYGKTKMQRGTDLERQRDRVDL
jgi:hypothetical protein